MTTGLDDLIAAVDESRMATTVAALAGDRFTGRRVGTPGSSAARDWLAGRLRDFGALVQMGEFPVRSVPEVYAAARATWHDGAVARPLVFGRDVTVHLASAGLPVAVRGDLAVAGAEDPAGRWLLVPAGMSFFDAYGHADGAAGLVIGRAVDADGWHYTMLAGPEPGPLPVLTVDLATHAAMLDRRGWLEADAPIRRADVTAANVYGRWDAAADLLLTAHYDGVGDLPGLRQPAAADNASGVAVVLEAARILGPALPGGLSVALLDAEEVGALGSAHHAAQLRRAGAAPAVINIDGAGRLGRAAAVEAGGPAHGLLAVLDQAGRHTGLPLAPGPVASDNRRYAAAGFAAAGIGAGMDGYHSPADMPDRVDPATLATVCRFVVASAWLAATVSPRISSLIGD
ncbi:M28 family metallopeptidase [Actinoplanes sp. NPDC051513]|uniref:M28 family metallopeptidase n=1 Tax=Actinoplanes sp. NPDC051513 TaxID=3363908 RepID=UPI0037AB70AE